MLRYLNLKSFCVIENNAVFFYFSCRDEKCSFLVADSCDSIERDDNIMSLKGAVVDVDS